MARQPEGPPPAPVVQRVRVHYAKRGRLRFTSHRDFQRALERALRRAGIPIAFSAGFTPHPKVSYSGAAPTGVASEAEYVELGLQERLEPEQVRERLDAALPSGLDVIEVVEARAPGALADRLEASQWEMRLPVPAEIARSALAELLGRDEVIVERTTRKGVRRFDARAAVVGASVLAEPVGDPSCAILHMVVRHTTPAVRPDDVLTALRQVTDLVPPEPVTVTRLAQGWLSEGGRIADPLAPDRGAAAADADSDLAPDEAGVVGASPHE